MPKPIRGHIAVLAAAAYESWGVDDNGLAGSRFGTLLAGQSFQSVPICSPWCVLPLRWKARILPPSISSSKSAWHFTGLNGAFYAYVTSINQPEIAATTTIRARFARKPCSLDEGCFTPPTDGAHRPGRSRSSLASGTDCRRVRRLLPAPSLARIANGLPDAVCLMVRRPVVEGRRPGCNPPSDVDHSGGAATVAPSVAIDSPA